ncbi:hypothetical protein MFLAVUS_009852 [Mucor flavus]|uniref:Uncharacterized protein n=1 Tax=Mucor flavus TaxID=439312 RepID=A0ABP9ZB20_9FUNG
MSQKNREDSIHGYFMKVFQSNKSLDGHLVKLNVRYFNDQHRKEELYCRHYNATSAGNILNEIKRRFDKIDRMEAVIIKASNKNIEIVDNEDLLVSIFCFQLNVREEESKHGLDISIKIF